MRRAVFLLLPLVCLVLQACAPPPPASKPRTREEFRALVKGKTRAEILELLGKPESTHTHGFEDGYLDAWTYRGVCHDPVADRTDFSTTISFGREGKVDRVDH